MSVFKDSEVLHKYEFKYKGVNMTFKAVTEWLCPHECFDLHDDVQKASQGGSWWFCAVLEDDGDNIDTLGMCSFRSFDAFLESGHFQDMKETVYQSRLESWCEREISKLTCVSYLVSACQKANLVDHQNAAELDEFSFENWNNVWSYRCACCGEIFTEDDKDTILDETNSCPSCSLEINSEDDLELEPAEILEYWMVDRWQFEKLGEIGEVVFEACNLYFWGRTTSGQAIILDGVFQKIFESINKEGE